MDAQKLLDKVLKASHERVMEDLRAMLGVELSFSEARNACISKEDYFESVAGKQIVAKISISGDIEGKGCLAIGIKDAIFLGGTLIMLPAGELEEVAGREEYTEEIEDSYGEIANIIAGSYTKVFEEIYPKGCRLVRKEQEIIIPTKVDIDSDDPMPDQTYYHAECKIGVGEKQLGHLSMLLPAQTFGLQTGQKASSLDAGAEGKTQTSQHFTSQETSESELHQSQPGGQQNPPQTAPAADFDVTKHKKKVDRLLKDCCKKAKEDVSALLGTEVVLGDLENAIVSKEDFFGDCVSGKQVLTNMEIVGELEDLGYLCMSASGAIHIGGTLIMLPPSELETVVSEQDFNEDTEDAYGEIANIISGAYTAVFEEQYIKKIRFIKSDIAGVQPMKVDTDSNEPVPDIAYYRSTMSLSVGGTSLDKVHMLIPARALQLESLCARNQAQPQSETAADAARSATGGGNSQGIMAGEAMATDGSQGSVDILLISDDEAEALKVIAEVESRGYTVRNISFKDDLRNHLTSQLKAVYLIMREVNEQAFGMAIKVSSSSSLPLIAAGPAWTRSKVIKAVKYGVNDILLTPASEEDIRENLDNNLLALAA